VFIIEDRNLQLRVNNIIAQVRNFSAALNHFGHFRYRGPRNFR